jgi:hypothetical protein
VSRTVKNEMLAMRKLSGKTEFPPQWRICGPLTWRGMVTAAEICRHFF